MSDPAGPGPSHPPRGRRWFAETGLIVRTEEGITETPGDQRPGRTIERGRGDMSESAHQQHVQAVGFAGMAVEELQQQIVGLREKTQEVLSTVTNAVGEEPSIESGRNALTLITAVDEMVLELIRRCDAAKEELNRYGRGF